MNIYQLEVFQLVAESENLSHVANRLYVSQPAISQLINRLESELNVKLFDRVNNKLQLNKFGEEYLQYVNKALRILMEGHQRLENMSSLDSGVLDIIDSGHSLLISYFLQNFQDEYPKVELSHHFEFGKGAVELLLKGKADFWITTERYYHPDISIQEIGEVCLYAAIPESIMNTLHLNSYENEISLDIFLSLPIISAPIPFDARVALDTLCHKENFKLNLSLESVDFGIIDVMNQKGKGVSYFTSAINTNLDSYIDDYFNLNNFNNRRVLRIKSPFNCFPLRIAMLKDHYISLSAEHFINNMSDTLASKN